MQLTGTNRPRTYHKTHPLCSSRSTGTHPNNSTRVTAAIAEGKRPDPSRTRKLSPPAPMVLHPPGCGRVGHRRTHPQKRGPHPGGPFFVHQYALLITSSYLIGVETERHVVGTGYGTTSPLLAAAAMRVPSWRTNTCSSSWSCNADCLVSAGGGAQPDGRLVFTAACRGSGPVGVREPLVIDVGRGWS